MTTYGVTGHRDVEQEPGELLQFARLTVERMAERGCTEIITGMARGWDLKVARAAADIGVPYCAAVPFPGQETRWSIEDRKEYERAMHLADRIELVCKLPLNESYWRRNEWIVDHSTELWSFWNGEPGGTRHCTLYAGEVGRIVRPLWEPWTRFRAERT